MTIVKIEEECGRRIVARIEEGIKGDQGMDAYEVALLEGFVGSREEWLESLIGPPVPVAQELGDDPNLAVSQKLLKDSINKMEDNNSTVVSDVKKYSDASKVSADASAKSAAAAKGSENLAETYKNATKVSETNSKASELAAAKSEGNASKSEAAALVSEGKAKDSETKASSSAAAALSSEKASDVSAKAAKASETASKASETAASKSQTAAKASQDAAKVSENAAKTAQAQAQKIADSVLENTDISKDQAAKSSKSATESGQSATEAASSASKALTSEKAAKDSQDAAKIAQDAAEDSNKEAKEAAAGAKRSETVAVEKAVEATSAVETARGFSDAAASSVEAVHEHVNKAKDWAENPVNKPVEGDMYSAKHWASVAQGNVNGDNYLTKSGNLRELVNKEEAKKNLGIKGEIGDGPEWLKKGAFGIGGSVSKDVVSGWDSGRSGIYYGISPLRPKDSYDGAMLIFSYAPSVWRFAFFGDWRTNQAYVCSHRGAIADEDGFNGWSRLLQEGHDFVLGRTVLDARKSLQLDPLVPMGGGKLSYQSHELANQQDIEGLDSKVALVNEGLQAFAEDVVLDIERTNEGIQELATLLDQNTSAIAEDSQKIIAIYVGELAANTATELNDKKYLGTSYYVDHSTVVNIVPQYDSGVGKVVAPIDTTAHSLHRIVTVTAADKEIHVKLKLGEPNMSGSIYVSVLREHTLIWESNCIFLNDSMPEPKEDGTAQYLVSYLQIGSNIFLNATEVKFG